jgi:hypothetical protein
VSPSSDACEAMARTVEAIAEEHREWSGRELLVELGVRVAGIARGPLSALGLLLGGRTRVRGGGFQPGLHDRTTGQSRHFAGVARAVTLLGASRTEWLSVHLRRDPPDSPDGRLTTLAVEFAGRVLDGSLPTRDAGDWIRRNVCD